MDIKEHTKWEKLINKISWYMALLCVVIQEFLLWLFLWLGSFDFTTRRPALGLMAMFAVCLGAIVFICTVYLLTNALRDPQSAILREAIENWKKRQVDE